MKQQINQCEQKSNTDFWRAKNIDCFWCMECGESITNPICPECIVEQAIACIADKQIAGSMKKWEVDELKRKLAVIITANYADAGIDCISCKTTFAICPHCTARYLRNILPRNLFYVGNANISEQPKNPEDFFDLFSSTFNY